MRTLWPAAVALGGALGACEPELPPAAAPSSETPEAVASVPCPWPKSRRFPTRRLTPATSSTTTTA